MDERRRLERVVLALPGHLARGDPAQVVVDEREQRLEVPGRLRVLEDPRNLARVFVGHPAMPGKPASSVWLGGGLGGRGRGYAIDEAVPS